MKQVEKTVVVFVADDGKEFLDKQSCRDYEANVLSVLDKIVYYKAYADPDVVNTQDFQKVLYFAVLDETGCATARTLLWLEQNIGKVLCYYGDNIPIMMWTLPVGVLREQYLEASTDDIPNARSERIFISPHDVQGFPAAVQVERLIV